MYLANRYDLTVKSEEIKRDGIGIAFINLPFCPYDQSEKNFYRSYSGNKNRKRFSRAIRKNYMEVYKWYCDILFVKGQEPKFKYKVYGILDSDKNIISDDKLAIPQKLKPHMTSYITKICLNENELLIETETGSVYSLGIDMTSYDDK